MAKSAVEKKIAGREIFSRILGEGLSKKVHLGKDLTM